MSTSSNSTIRSIGRDIPREATKPIPKVSSSGNARDLSFRSAPATLAEKQKENSLLAEWSVGTWIWIILVPVVVYFLLLLLVPSFVVKDDNGGNPDHRALLLWTLIISLIIWVMLWGLNYCKSC